MKGAMETVVGWCVIGLYIALGVFIWRRRCRYPQTWKDMPPHLLQQNLETLERESIRKLDEEDLQREILLTVQDMNKTLKNIESEISGLWWVLAGVGILAFLFQR